MKSFIRYSYINESPKLENSIWQSFIFPQVVKLREITSLCMNYFKQYFKYKLYIFDIKNSIFVSLSIFLEKIKVSAYSNFL